MITYNGITFTSLDAATEYALSCAGIDDLNSPAARVITSFVQQVHIQSIKVGIQLVQRDMREMIS